MNHFRSSAEIIPAPARATSTVQAGTGDLVVGTAVGTVGMVVGTVVRIVVGIWLGVGMVAGAFTVKDTVPMKPPDSPLWSLKLTS